MVGIVALAVFGPKGLADAAKSVGNIIRTLQPTIREVASISNDLKSTLEDELRLDELRNEFDVRVSTDVGLFHFFFLHALCILCPVPTLPLSLSLCFCMSLCRT